MAEFLRKYRVFPIFCTVVTGFFMWHIIKWITATPYHLLNSELAIGALGVGAAVVTAGFKALSSVMQSVDRDGIEQREK